MTSWRWGLVAWTVASIVVVASQGYGVLAILAVWFVGILVIGGVRAAFGSAFRR